MKAVLFLTCFLFLCILNGQNSIDFSQYNYNHDAESNEVNCFSKFHEKEFSYSATNAYLLSYLSWLMYPERLATDIGDELHNKEETQYTYSEFSAQYQRRFMHMFCTKIYPNQSESEKLSLPKFKFIFQSNEVGDPESMLISTENYILIVFRGTDRVERHDLGGFNWKNEEWYNTDFNIFQTELPIPGVSGIKVHTGINNSLLSIQDQIYEFIRSNNANLDKNIWITGHSLGGGLAQLLTFKLLYSGLINNKKIHCYTFGGPPKIGNLEFAKALNTNQFGSKNGFFQRFEFRNDFITMIAPPAPYYYAGLRNLYSDEGRNKIELYCKEREFLDFEVSIPSPCDHQPAWYVRAAFDGLTPSVQQNLPSPPCRPTNDSNGWPCGKSECN